MSDILFKRFKSSTNEDELPAKTIPTNNCDLQKEALNTFREQLIKDEKGIDIPTDDATLLRFLRAKNFNVKQSVALVHRSQQWKQKNEDMLSIPFEDCKGILENEVVNVLKQRDAKGRRVIYIRAKNWNPEELSLTHGCKAGWHLIEEIIREEETQNNGVVGIFDLGDLPLAKIAYFVSFFTFKQCHRLITFYQGGFPIKVKGVYFISSPMIVSSLFMSVKYLLKKKLRDRIIVDSTGPHILHGDLGKENLPDILAGDVPFEQSLDKEVIKAVFSGQKF